MARFPSFSSPFLLGFGEIERLLQRLSTGDGYPPCNIQRLPGSSDQSETLRITLAVAGFSDDELDVRIEGNQLVVRGRQKDETAHDFLYRGIAARQFQKSFVLADGIEVKGAALADGLLTVDLARPQNAGATKRIAISGRA